jgi:thiamine biosynthesis lipoprotein
LLNLNIHLLKVSDLKYKFLLVIFCLASFLSNGQLKRYAFMQPKMGSPLNIIFYSEDSVVANRLANQCFALVDTLNQIFSDYLPESELNQLSATAGKDSFVQVSPLLYDIILDSRKAWQQSSQVFDITIGPLTRLWRKARKMKSFPTSEEIQKNRALVGFDKIIIDTVAQRIKLLQKGMQLDLGGIAKGYVAQKIIDFLQSKGVQQALVDAGGDLAASKAPPGTDGWHVGINLPENAEELLPRYLTIQDKAVATSGDIYQYIEHQGKKYSHIIDPGSGYGVTYQRNVTVIAKDGALADWLASACSILSIRKAKKIARRNHASLLITYLHRGEIRLETTSDFAAFWNKK